MCSAQLCIDLGEFRDDVDPEQFAFGLFALVTANHFHTRLLRDLAAPERTLAAFERLITAAQSTQ